MCPIDFRGSGHPITSVFSVHHCVFRFFINFSMSLHWNILYLRNIGANLNYYPILIINYLKQNGENK